MTSHYLYPMLFHPIYKDYIWGGNKIASKYNRLDIPDRCSESWELSGLSNQSTIIANGYFEGDSLDRITNTFGRDLIGTKAENFDIFPLMIKILDVNQRLSIQVHPDKNAANFLGSRPKNEMWYILESDIDSGIWAGIKSECRIEDIRDNLIFYNTEKGQIYDLPAGIVHSASQGNLIFEVQQTSDTTYRIDDWGRGRPLHYHEACFSIHSELKPSCKILEKQYHGYHTTRGLRGFDFATLDLEHNQEIYTTEHSFVIVFCEYGEFVLKYDNHKMNIKDGMTILIPPKYSCDLIPSKKTKLLLTRL